jgi:hypothetical protein
MKPNGLKKGCYFKEQLTGEENLYQIMTFVNGQQQFMRRAGVEEYLESLKKANARSPCVQK